MATEGQIITFYSYKGGTGRSMAAVNIGCLLAKNLPENKTLIIDWDLEAPGLHHYFAAHLLNNRENDLGLIDLFLELNEKIPLKDDPDPNPYDGQTQDDAEVMLQKMDLNNRFIIPITNISNLYLLKAGRIDENYANAVTTFNWEHLYKRSPWLFRALANELATHYKYILIDSRTGLSDTANICTMLMPEKLVVVFTPNNQGLTGIEKLVEQAKDYRSISDDPRDLRIFPLASRIDTSRSLLEEEWRRGNKNQKIEGFQPLFEKLFQKVYGLQTCSLEVYFNNISIQHDSDFMYGEKIATNLGENLLLSQSYKRFMEVLIAPSYPWEQVTLSYLEQKDNNNDIINYIRDDLEQLSDEKLLFLCYDHFLSIHKRLNPNITKSILIEMILEFVWKNNQIGTLARALKRYKVISSQILRNDTRPQVSLISTIGDENASNTMISSPVEPNHPMTAIHGSAASEPPKATNLPPHVLNATNDQLSIILSNPQKITEEELKDVICFTMGIDYDHDLQGANNQPQRAKSLVNYCYNRINEGYVDKLKHTVYQFRPTIF